MPTDSATDMETIDDSALESTAQAPGDLLRASREQRGLSQKEVADTLHITVHYVNALEHNNYDKLPGEIFAKGYMKRYAEIMELDEAEVLEAYSRYRAAHSESGTAANQGRSRSSSGKNKLLVFASLALFGGLFTGLWYWNQQGQAVGTESSTTNMRTASPAEETTTTASTDLSGAAGRSTPAAAVQADSAIGQSGSPAIAEVVQEAEPTAATTSATAETEALESDLEEVVQEAPLSELSQASTADAAVTGISDSAPDPDSEQPLQARPQVTTDSQALVSEQQTEQPGQADSNVITIAGQGTDTLRISFSGASWVEVNDGGENQIYRDLREAGDVLEITGSAPFSILLGDAPFTRLTFNGSEIDVSDNIRIDNSARLTVGL